MIIGFLMITILPKLARTNEIPASRIRRRDLNARLLEPENIQWKTAVRGVLG